MKNIIKVIYIGLFIVLSLLLLFVGGFILKMDKINYYGGSVMVLEANNKKSVNVVKEILQDVKLDKQSDIAYNKLENKIHIEIMNVNENEFFSKIDLLKKRYVESNLSLISLDIVGSSVGEELRKFILWILVIWIVLVLGLIVIIKNKRGKK